MRSILMLFLLTVAIGCSSDSKAEPIPMDKVPDTVMKVAREKLPDVKFERAMKKANGEFEVIGKDQGGKTREIDIKPDGTVTEIE